MSSQPPKKAPAPPVHGDDVHGTATYYPERGLLVIHRRFEGKRKPVTTAYRVELLDPDPTIGSPAVRLTNDLTGLSFDLIRTGHGWQCECPDWHNRRQESGRMCKHLKALLNTGIIEMLPHQGDAYEG